MAFVVEKPLAAQWLWALLEIAAWRSNYSSFCFANRSTCFDLRLNFCDNYYLDHKKAPEVSPGGSNSLKQRAGVAWG
jgi:hypothetical protein